MKTRFPLLFSPQLLVVGSLAVHNRILTFSNCFNSFQNEGLNRELSSTRNKLRRGQSSEPLRHSILSKRERQRQQVSFLVFLRLAKLVFSRCSCRPLISCHPRYSTKHGIEDGACTRVQSFDAFSILTV